MWLSCTARNRTEKGTGGTTVTTGRTKPGPDAGDDDDDDDDNTTTAMAESKHDSLATATTTTIECHAKSQQL